MSNTPVPFAEVERTLAAFEACGRNQVKTAIALGISRGALQQRLIRAESQRSSASSVALEIEVPRAPDTREPINDLLARKKAQFARELAHEEWSQLINVRVKDTGPVALCAIGDPHLDDDGCDIGAVERDMTVIGRTRGMHAVHVGDFTNNWIGRLVAKFAHQKSTFDDGIRLCEWMFDLANPLVVVGGNHDKWNEGMTWLNFVMRRVGNPVAAADGVRINFQFPAGDDIRMHVRHDFPGHSQYNPLHGLRKEALFGFRDHINIAGHKHISAAGVVPHNDGTPQWMFRVEGYKRIDEYAKAGHFAPMRLGPAVALVINPTAALPVERVKPFWCMELAADYLTYLRKNPKGTAR